MDVDERRKQIRKHTDLDVYKRAFEVGMRIFVVTKGFPSEEKYSLTDQIRRSSRSVSSNIAEAWRKRRYPAAFVSKLADAEGEGAETQVWLQYSVSCGYLDRLTGKELYKEYDNIIGMLVNMSKNNVDWKLP